MSNRRRLFAWFASLLALLPSAGLPAARAADELVVEFDGLALPIDLADLEAWTRTPTAQHSTQAVWLYLLDPEARLGLIRLLQAPLLRDRSFGMELLSSWTGEQLLREVGTILQGEDGQNTAPELLASLRQLFARQQEVSSLALLRAIPQRRLTLRIDRLLGQAEQGRAQLRLQRQAINLLRSQPLPLRRSQPLLPAAKLLSPQRLLLSVPHRPTPLPVQVWARAVASSPVRSTWLLLLPGLGGSSSHLSWLARALAERGWPVVVVDHPGSDEQAVKESLLGDGPPPGAESVPQRLADVQAVLAARADGRIGWLGGASAEDEGLVLIGHSLGALTALMAAGLVPEAGLQQRCERVLVSLPLANISRLLQCHLPAITGDGATPLPQSEPLLHLGGIPLRGVVAFNSFGSLLWPRHGLADLPVPVLMVGGSLDLVTPPLQEQLGLLVTSGHPRSRLVLVDGGSHFSPVRLPADRQALFRLGQALVGEEPERVQALLLQLTLEFLESARHPALLAPQRRDHAGVQAYVLDPAAARRWQQQLPRIKSAPVGPAGPPADPPRP